MNAAKTGVALLAVCVLTFLVGEGLYSVARFERADQSIAYKTYQMIFPEAGASRAKMEALDPHVVVSETQFEELLDQFLAYDVGLGNTLYRKLVRDRASINYTESGCKLQKPNLDKAMVRLRTMLFNPFDPVLAFYDWHESLSPDLRTFLERYQVSTARLRSNEFGERLTIPYLERSDKVLVVGDSKANGTGISDEETLSSQLQQLDDSVQYINIGVAGADAKDIICNLRRATERYAGQVRKIIYVYCENDFDPRLPFGTPDEVLAVVHNLEAAYGIAKILFVYSPAIYNIAPEVTRMRGYRGWRWDTHAEEKRRLRELVSKAGYDWIDLMELGREKVQEARSIFAVLALFVDQNHLSPEGTRRLAERILEQS